MIVICEECGKNYRIDSDNLKQDETQFKCKDCGHQITIRKPEISSAVTGPQPISAPVDESLAAADPAALEDAYFSAKSKKEKNSYAFTRTPKTRFGLTAKLFTMMTIISLVPLFTFWGATLKQTRDYVRYESRKNLNRQYARIVRNLDGWFDSKVRMIKSLAGVEQMMSMQKERQEALLMMVRDLHVEMNTIFSLNPNGRFWAGNLQGLPLEHKDLSYFKAIQNRQPYAWQTVLSGKMKKPGLVIAAPIVSQNTLVGVLGCFFAIDTVSNQIQSDEDHQTDFALLIKNGDHTIVHQRADRHRQTGALSWQPLVERMNQGKGGLLPVKDPAGKSRLTFIDTTSFGWGLAVQAEEQESLYMQNRLTSFAFLLLAVTVILIIVIAWFSGKALSRPIVRLTNAADRISVGELDMEIRTNRKDEIGDLSDAIARLQDSIRLSIERLRQRR